MSTVSKFGNRLRLRYKVYYPTGEIVTRSRYFHTRQQARIKASLANTIEAMTAHFAYDKKQILEWHYAGLLSQVDVSALSENLPDAGKTLSQCFDEWEATWQVTDQEAQTRWSRRRTILQIMGDTSIKKLTLEHGYELIRLLRDSKHKTETIRKYIRDLKQALNYQVALRYLKYNPFAALSAGRIPAEEKIKPKVFTDKQIVKILEQAEERDKMKRPWLGGTLTLHLLLFFGTGLRRREAQESRLEHINWKERSLTLPATITKTGKSRTVGLGTNLYEALLPRKGQAGYILPRFAPLVVSKTIKNHFKACGIDARLHDTRHTYVSMLQDTGVKPHDAIQRTGHTDLKMLSRYSHGNFHEVYEDKFDFLKKNLNKITTK